MSCEWCGVALGLPFKRYAALYFFKEGPIHLIYGLLCNSETIFGQLFDQFRTIDKIDLLLAGVGCLFTSGTGESACGDKNALFDICRQ